jgi:hypothetical protein
MDIAWIQVFVLTIAECVAPAGKTVCQEQELEMIFLTENDCNVVLEQLLTLKSAAENVIVNAERSSCAPTARKKQIFSSLDEINSSYGDIKGWRTPDIDESKPDFTQASHNERLESLKSCEESDGVAPCKIGEIVIEAAATGEPVEIWRRDQ